MRTGKIHDLLPGGTVRLITHFILFPELKLHFRALKQRTRLGTGALQRELSRLEGLGLIVRSDEGGKVYYAPVVEHPSWGAFRTLLRQHADPVEVLREALLGVTGIKAAFVYGSTVRGDTRPDSDIDVFIIEDGMPLHEIGRASAEAQNVLDREIDLRWYTAETIVRKVERGNGYLRRVFAEPKSWLIGSEDFLPAGEVA